MQRWRCQIRTKATLAAVLLAGLAGCRDEERRREAATADLAALSQDFCVKDWLTDAQRERLLADARSGQLPSEAVEAYLKDLRGLVREAKAANLSSETFCVHQRNLFRRQLLR